MLLGPDSWLKSGWPEVLRSRNRALFWPFFRVFRERNSPRPTLSESPRSRNEGFFGPFLGYSRQGIQPKPNSPQGYMVKKCTILSRNGPIEIAHWIAKKLTTFWTFKRIPLLVRHRRLARTYTHMTPFWPPFRNPFKPFPACFGPFLTSLLTSKRPFLAYLAQKGSFLTSYLKSQFESTPGLTHVFDKRSQKGYPKSRSFSCMWRILRVLFQVVTRPTLIKRQKRCSKSEHIGYTIWA